MSVSRAATGVEASKLFLAGTRAGAYGGSWSSVFLYLYIACLVLGEIYHRAFIWIYMSVSRATAGVEASKLFLAAISFVAALGFLLYGGS
ncbi:hypothetical protein TanjilG_27977 [Lupinus angustifolius]|uniref:THH1/TOM1/TOM3 domain-containing protein n=1 Tax=Lupinus angustifolius TaxID=3871 RepID=A0A4P1RG26_LUPAN|nr:hypothetical protein TanjilG_27977 [Lupinus angustifolius]